MRDKPKARGIQGLPKKEGFLSRHPMLVIQLKTLWRKKGSSLLIFTVMAVMAVICSVLSGRIARQSDALKQTVETSQIRCTVTDSRGQTSDIGIFSTYLDMLVGVYRESGCSLDEYVKDVNAMAKQSLSYPADAELRRIYSLESDLSLQSVEGAVIQFYDGWTKECLQGSEQICLISGAMSGYVEEDEDGAEWIILQTEDGAASFQVIGRVSGTSGNVIWCPFYAPMEEGISYAWQMDSCSFLIQDNAKLDEAKEELFSWFSVPTGTASPAVGAKAGLLVQDESYLLSLTELENNLSLLRFLLPLMFVLSAGINFLISYLTNRRRMNEFAVMRCMGQRPSALFSMILFQHGLLTVTGCILGLLLGIPAVSASPEAFVSAALVLIFGLSGSVGAALRISRIKPIILMKAED